MNGNNTDVRRLTELALLTAAALIMFVVELQLPPLFPIYGAKLGLANIITVYCVYKYSPKEAGLVTAVRVILGAVFASSFSTILFSAAGALFCLAGMIPVSKLFPRLPIFVCSVIGAVLHNLGQILAGRLYLGTPAVYAVLPYMMLCGCAAGLFTGLCTQLIISRAGKASGKFRRR